MGRKLLAGLCLLMFSQWVYGVELAGHIAWGDKRTLSILESGIVTNVNVYPGQRVNQGDVLVALDPEPFQADIVNAEAALAASSLMLEEANNEMERAEALYDRTVLSDQALMQAKIGKARAAAKQAADAARLVTAQQRLAQSQIKAPFSGTVLAVNIRQGEAVLAETQPQVLVTLAKNDFWSVTVEVQAETIKQVEIDQKIKVLVSGRRYPASVDQMYLEPNDAGFYQLRAIFSAGKLPSPMAGQAASILLP